MSRHAPEMHEPQSAGRLGPHLDPRVGVREEEHGRVGHVRLVHLRGQAGLPQRAESLEAAVLDRPGQVLLLLEELGDGLGDLALLVGLEPSPAFLDIGDPLDGPELDPQRLRTIGDLGPENLDVFGAGRFAENDHGLHPRHQVILQQR